MEAVIKLIVFAGLATGFAIAAERSAARVGLPAGLVPVISGVVVGVVGRG